VNAPSAIIVLVLTTAKFPRWVERSRRRRRRGTVLSGRMVLCHGKRHTLVSTACTALDWLWATIEVEVEVMHSATSSCMRFIYAPQLYRQALLRRVLAMGILSVCLSVTARCRNNGVAQRLRVFTIR